MPTAANARSSGWTSGFLERNAATPRARSTTTNTPATAMAATAIQETGTYGTWSAVDGSAGAGVASAMIVEPVMRRDRSTCGQEAVRSEERRVGKECSSPGTAYH